MRFLKKNPIFSLVLGILIAIYAILTRFIDHPIFNLDAKLGLIIIGLALLAFALLVVLTPLTSKRLKGIAFVVIAIQFALLVYGSFSGFILPAFNVNVPKIPYLNSGSQWFGFALVTQGAISIILNTYNKLTLQKVLVYLNLTFVIFGVVVYERNLVNKHLDWVTFAAMLVTGLVLIVIGLINKKKA